MSDDDLMSELKRRMPKVPTALLTSHLDTARCVMANCANRLGLVAGIINEPTVRTEIGRLMQDWGTPDV